MLSILTTLFAPLIAAIPSMSGLLIPIGLYILNLFVSNANQKAANEKQFLDAVQAHMNDGLQSVAERQNAWAQRQELLAKAKAADSSAKDLQAKVILANEAAESTNANAKPKS